MIYSVIDGLVRLFSHIMGMVTLRLPVIESRHLSIIFNTHAPNSIHPQFHTPFLLMADKDDDPISSLSRFAGPAEVTEVALVGGRPPSGGGRGGGGGAGPAGRARCHLVAIFNDFTTAGYAAGDSVWGRLTPVTRRSVVLRVGKPPPSVSFSRCRSVGPPVRLAGLSGLSPRSHGECLCRSGAAGAPRTGWL